MAAAAAAAQLGHAAVVARCTTRGLGGKQRLGRAAAKSAAAPLKGIALRKASRRASCGGARATLEDEAYTLDTKAGEEHGILPSGEWPENFSMLNYEDLSAHYAPAVFKKEAQPDTILADIMAKQVWSAKPDTPVSEVNHHFEDVTGVPVVNDDLVCIGVLSKKDVAKSPNGSEGRVGDIMSTPAITITAGKTVRDAAVRMLKDKIHRLPVVNDEGQLVGIVTRTDIFTALEGLPSQP